MNNEKKSSILIKISYLFLLLPFIIFVIGWMKWYFSIPITIVLFICFVKLCKDAPKVWIPELTRDNILKTLVIICVIALWVYFSGIGKFVFQNEDHQTRNAIFNILVEYKWPVINTDILQGVSSVGDIFKDTPTTGLIYYIGYWLPSAVIGKLFGIRAGYYAQAVWALLGICLVYYLICVFFKKLAIWPLVAIVFFSGLDIVGHYFTGTDLRILDSSLHLEWWSTPYQYSSMTTQLFWVFNQAIPAWLCTMLFMTHKNNRSLVFILSCSLLSSTFPFMGLLILTVFFLFTRRYHEASTKQQYLINWTKDTFTVQNVLGGGIIGIVSFIYLIGNFSSNVLGGKNVYGPELNNSLPKYILFLIMEIGIYILLLYKYNKENKLFYFTLLCLCLIPPIKIGYSIDFCMRVSIPFLLILSLFVIQAIWKAWDLKDYFILASLVITVLIGSVTPIHEFTRTFSQTFSRINSGEIVYAEDKANNEILSLENFVGDTEKSFFFKHLAK